MPGMCRRFPCKVSFASRRGELDHMTGLATHMTLLFSDGTGNFSIKTLSKTSDCAIKLATLKVLVPALSPVQNTLSSSISQALIPSHSTTATAASNLCRTGPNFCANDGFWLLFHVHRWSSPSIALKLFMN